MVILTCWDIIKKSIKDYYEHLYLLFLINVICFFICGPLLYLAFAGILHGSYFWFIIHIFVVGPLMIGVFYLANCLINDKRVYISVKTMFEGTFTFYWKGVGAYLFSVLIAGILLIDYHFFYNSSNPILHYISGFWLYLLVFFLMSQLYYWSLLIEREKNILVTIKEALILTFSKIGYTIVIFIVILLLFIIGIVSLGLIFAVLFISITAILATNATFNLLVEQDG